MFDKKFLAAGLSLLPSALFAFQIDFGGGPQQEQYRGWINYKGTQADVKKDLHIKDRVKGFGYVNIRHHLSLLFIPIPDVKVSYLEVKSDGTGTVTRSFKFGVVTVNATDRVYTKFKFNQWDITFYYTPIDLKLLDASWGFGVKVIDFYGYVRSLTTGQSDSKSATIPLPYLYARIGTGFSFIHAYVEGKGITAGGNNYFYDVDGAIGLGYKFNRFVGISLDGGYRYQKYRVDDVDDISANIRMKGGFGKLSLNFVF